MLNSSLYDYNDAYILAQGRIAVVGQEADDTGITADRNNKEVVFKNGTPFVNCISKINNAEVDNAEDLDIVMAMYNLLEYNENYTKISASSWKYCRDKPDDSNITDSKLCKFKSNITDNINNAGIANVKIVVPLKYLCNSQRTFEIPLINCDVTLNLNWSENCAICEADRVATFAMTSVKIYVPVVTQDDTR